MEAVDDTMLTHRLQGLIFLGTSSGVPTLERGTSCTALEVAVSRAEGQSRASSDTEYFLIDCGEGTQQQILRHNAQLGRKEEGAG